MPNDQPKTGFSTIFQASLWRLAWRDARPSLRRLAFFIAGITVGVAALVAIRSFGDSLQNAVDEQAKSLIGADFVLKARAPFTAAAESLIDSLGGDQSRQIAFASMAVFSPSNATRLVQVRAMRGKYPYYGRVETEPASAADEFQEGEYALIDGSLSIQFDVGVGDTMRIGSNPYLITGLIKAIPGESAASGSVGPRVFIPLDKIDEGLLDVGSIAQYRVAFKMPESFDGEEFKDSIRPFLRSNNINADTVEEVRTEYGNALRNLYRFLAMSGFIALLLGAVGIASAINVYVKWKVNAVATLRCIGATTSQAFSLFLIQAACMGLGGAILGAAIGLGLQYVMPIVLAEFLPVDVDLEVSYSAVFQGTAVGTFISIAFALFPLLQVRSISPLRALRASVETPVSLRKDPYFWIVTALVAVVLGVMAVQLMETVSIGLILIAGLAVVFGLLYAVAMLVLFVARRARPSAWPFVWRQGFLNLQRPNNQTLMLILSLGLSTFLIMVLFLTETALLREIAISGGEGQPNTILFDVQRDQRDGVTAILDSLDSPAITQDPMVTMRLASVKGRTVAELRRDTTTSIPRWLLYREYRSTYRSSLSNTEKVVEGTFVPKVEEGASMVPISIEADMASDLGVTIGDKLVFDVQSRPIEVTVSSFREVDWQQLSANFFVVFPEGVLERAPQQIIVTARTETREQSSILQRTMVAAYPNVSIIDLETVLTTVEDLFSKVRFVIQFMALFSMLTGLVVLVGAVMATRFQRLRESVLLRTIGAGRKQIRRIILAEYLFLGALAACTGLALSLGAGWALCRFMFQVSFVPPVGPILIAIGLVTAVTITVGLLNSRGLFDRPPLEVLRADAA